MLKAKDFQECRYVVSAMCLLLLMNVYVLCRGSEWCAVLTLHGKG